MTLTTTPREDSLRRTGLRDQAFYQPGFEPATSQSQVQNLSHYTTGIHLYEQDVEHGEPLDPSGAGKDELLPPLELPSSLRPPANSRTSSRPTGGDVRPNSTEWYSQSRYITPLSRTTNDSWVARPAPVSIPQPKTRLHGNGDRPNAMRDINIDC